MAIPVSIESLIGHQTVESSRIEFKRGFNPAAVIRTICAFANDIDNLGGGYIIVGIEEENGTPKYPITGIPLDQIDGIQKKLLQYCHSIEPLYLPVTEPVQYGEAWVLVIWVPGGHGRPYKAPRDVTSSKTEKEYFIRKLSSTVVASHEEEKELFYISSSIPFDDRPNLTAEIGDLDIGLMREHLREIGSNLYPLSLKMDIAEIATDMQLIEGPAEDRRPLNVGLLMFSEHTQRFFRYARIEIVDIPDPTGNGMTEKIFTGPIQRQLRDALSYLRNYVLREVVLKDARKAEATRIWNYPYTAIEEILSNAVYHRSYQIPEPITVRITAACIEITSFPGFDRSISDEAIARQEIRARSYRNRRIGDFLKELHLIEGRNTGFPNARKALQDNGSGPLKFDMDPDRSYLAVTIPIHNYFAPDVKTEKQLQYEDKILACLQNQQLDLTALAKEMGYKSISKKLRVTVEALVQQQRIKQITIGSKIKYTV